MEMILTWTEYEEMTRMSFHLLSPDSPASPNYKARVCYANCYIVRNQEPESELEFAYVEQI